MKHRLSRMLGFTMIELLVVIAVIGILAVAVLSAINPIEQINKGKDTRTRSDASELLGSIERYYATQENYPWEVASTVAPLWTAIAPLTEVTFGDAAGEFNWAANLASSQEIKSQFSSRLISAYGTTIAATPAFILVKDADTASVTNPTYICFLPSSQQFKIEATRKCCTALGAGGICANAGSAVNTTPDAFAGGFDPCGSRAGDVAAVNYICLP